MAYETILFEKRGGVGLITLNRPEKLNAWTWQMNDEIVDAIQQCNNDDDIGAIVWTGAGRAFCAGADIKQAFAKRLEKDYQEGPPRSDEGVEHMFAWDRTLREAKPIVVAVNGIAVGVGLTQILATDVRLASDRAQFGMFFVKMGLVTELGSSYYLAQHVGLGRASEMCLTGRLVDAQEAERIGLVNRTVPHDRLLDEAIAVAEQIAANPPPSVRQIKGLFTANAVEQNTRSVFQREGEALEVCRRSPEHREAVRAFLEKRPPNFRAAREQEGAAAKS